MIICIDKKLPKRVITKVSVTFILFCFFLNLFQNKYYITNTTLYYIQYTTYITLFAILFVSCEQHDFLSNTRLISEAFYWYRRRICPGAIVILPTETYEQGVWSTFGTNSGGISCSLIALFMSLRNVSLHSSNSPRGTGGEWF